MGNHTEEGPTESHGGARTGWRGPRFRQWQTWAEGGQLQRHEDKLLLVLTLLIGAGVGLVVVAFMVTTERLAAFLLPPDAEAWRRVAVPTAGALVSGLLLAKYFPQSRGSGIPQTKAALFLQRGHITLRTVVGKFVCSALSLGTGIALGREGPTVQIGAGIASVLGRRLGLGAARVQALIPVGTAAAVAAAFNTPLSAVLFTLEEILGDLHAAVLGSVVIASATSWAVLQLLLGDEPLFHVPAYQLVHPGELGIYAVLGLVGGLVSVAFVRLLLTLRSRFQRLPRATLPLQPMVGGLSIGLLGLAVPSVLGVGYGFVGDALNGRMLFGGMALLLVLKVLATATAYASGNAGGIFGPSLFIGAMLGGALGSVAHSWLPDVTGSPGAYALVGMGTAFAGIVRAPMTSVVMIFEITRDYSIIVPLMVANLLSYLVSQRLQPQPVYEALLRQDGITLPLHSNRPLARATQGEAPDDANGPGATPPRTLATVLAVGVLGLLFVGGILANHYYSGRMERARVSYERGRDLVRQHRETEAVEAFRTALSLRHDEDSRLALGLALAQSGRSPEARVYLEQVLQQQPDSGPANLAMARIARTLGDRPMAIAHYRRAIGGGWPGDASSDRSEALFELVSVLAESGARRQAEAELLGESDRAATPDVLVRIGEALRQLGATAAAEEVFRDAIAKWPQNVGGYLGLGEALLSRDQFAAALEAYREAVERDPSNVEAREGVAFSLVVSELDPTARGLTRRQRYDRSQRLLAALVDDAEACLPGARSRDGEVERAQVQATRRRPAGLSDATEANLALASSLWTTRSARCGTSPAPRPLARVMEHLDR